MGCDHEMGLLSVEDAFKLIGETVADHSLKDASELVSVTRALGRITARPLKVTIDGPSFDQSAMDGIAFRADSVSSAMTILGTVAAGDPPDQILPEPGTCVRIMTGAPLPSTCDTVQMIEYVEIEADRARLTEVPDLGSHIRKRGENVRAGDPLFPVGTFMTPPRCAAAAAQGLHFVEVVRPLRVLVGSTGNELMPPHLPLKPGQIYDSNGPGLETLLSGPGIRVHRAQGVGDDLQMTTAFLEKAKDFDVIVLSGGVSMGDFDFVPAAAEVAGFRKVFHKLAMKPGKPLWFGAHSRGSLFFGLPGNPVSALVGAALFIKPALAALAGSPFQAPRSVPLPLVESVRNRGSRVYFAPATLVRENGRTKVRPIKTSGSGDLVRFAAAEALIKVPAGGETEAGQAVEVFLPFTPGFG